MDSLRFLKGLSMPPLRKGQSANVKECKWDFLGKTGAFKKILFRQYCQKNSLPCMILPVRD